MSCIVLSTSGREKSSLRYRKLLEKLGILDIEYKVFQSSNTIAASIDPEDFIKAVLSVDVPCIGAAISKDIKGKVVRFLNELDDSARIVQSVNTIVNENGVLTGYNTDVYGFREAISHSIEKAVSESLRPCKNAIIYGYGGVTSVAVHVLISLGVTKIYLTGRNLHKAAERAAELKVSVWTKDIPCDIFINASPVTDFPLDRAENFLDALMPSAGPPQIVFDHEMPGLCLKRWVAEHPECPRVLYVSGYEMYYPQMKRQWGLFLRQRVDQQAVTTALDELIQEEVR